MKMSDFLVEKYQILLLNKISLKKILLKLILFDYLFKQHYYQKSIINFLLFLFLFLDGNFFLKGWLKLQLLIALSLSFSRLFRLKFDIRMLQLHHHLSLSFIWLFNTMRHGPSGQWTNWNSIFPIIFFFIFFLHSF